MILTKNGLYTQNKKTLKKETKISSLHGFMKALNWDELRIENGVKMRHFFNLLIPYPDLLSSMFQLDLHAFWKTLKSDLPEGDKIHLKNVKYCEVSWGVDTFRYKGKTDFSISPGFSGVSNPRGIRYSLSFTPWSGLANLPLKLNTEVKIQDAKDWKKTIFKGYREFRLYDVLLGILWDLGFYGTPEESSKIRSEVTGRMEDYKKRVKDGTYYSTKQVFKKLKSKKRRDGRAA